MPITINGSGTISGVNAGGLPAGSVTQTTLATNTATTGPAFSVYSTAGQAIAATTATKVQLNVKEFDTNNSFDATTNYRFQPTVAGYYQVNGQVEVQSQAAGELTLYIYKNGSVYRAGGDVNATTYSLTVSTLVYLNGSTDYIELWVWNATAKNLYNNSTVRSNYLNGFLARSA